MSIVKRTVPLTLSAVVLSDSQVREIYDIAENTGYSSPVHFSIMFKKQLGISPSKYN